SLHFPFNASFPTPSFDCYCLLSISLKIRLGFPKHGREGTTIIFWIVSKFQ
ncbi:unnamed protein product, partial [Musa textilis]